MAKVSQCVMRTLHQQLTQVAVAGFCDTKLGVVLARLLLPRLQTQIRADIAAVTESFPVSQCEYKR
jgi:peptide subunit release factor 1 (eRF1)